jgi:uncharacterized membrane-anchored protein
MILHQITIFCYTMNFHHSEITLIQDSIVIPAKSTNKTTKIIVINKPKAGIRVYIYGKYLNPKYKILRF